ncbi:hypothetical protein H0H93_014144 [Arthromyces matolae]|nr:hypothetical protein H0H93_014144 [Arthromyces matolae]
MSALRDDITTLIHAFHELYTNPHSIQPFSLFKNLWASLGWRWIHFIVLDDRPRQTFLNVFRTERMVKTEAPFTRAIALFGFYTFFYTQPQGTAPPLYSIAYISIPLDQLAALKALPESLNVTHLRPLRPHVSFILSVLLKEAIFLITPETDTRSLNPGELPREIFVEDAAFVIDSTAPRKKGRPPKRDIAKRARQGVDSLDKWLNDTSAFPLSTDEGLSIADHPLSSTLRRYQAEKGHLLDLTASESTSLQEANQFVVNRLRVAEGQFSTELALFGEGEPTGVTRVERAVDELGVSGAIGRRGGALNLLEGAGGKGVS